MNIKRYGLLFMLLFFYFSFLFSQQSANVYFLSSGSKGGNYYKTGVFIADQYNKHFKKQGINSRFRCIDSDGSIENLISIRAQEVDFAIVQRNELLNNLYDAFKGYKNIEVIAPLFEEKLIIYTHNNKSESIVDLSRDNALKNKKWGFTNKNGYSYKIFNKIAKYLELNTSNKVEIFKDYDELIPYFKNDSVDYLVTFSLPIEELESSKIKKAYFSESNVAILEDLLPNLFKTNLISGDNNKKTLGSWAFLIGDKSSISNLEKDNINLVKILLSQQDTSIIYSKYISDSFNDFKNNSDWESQYFNRIPMSIDLINELGYTKSYKSELLFLLSILILLILIIRQLIKNDKLPKLDEAVYYWYRYKHIIIGVPVIFLLYLLSVEILLSAEREFYRDVSIKSQLLNMTFGEVHFWIIIRNLTGIDNDIFPYSDTGKLMISFQTYLLWIGGGIIAFLEYLAYRLNKKRKQGIMKLKLKGHTVIFGWNDHTALFVKQIIEVSTNYENKNHKVVCIVKDPEETLLKYPYLQKLHSIHKLYFLKGNSRDNLTLENANIHLADTVVLLSDDNSIASDEKTLLRALAISRFCRRKALEDIKNSKTTNLTQPKSQSEQTLYETGKYVDPIYIIAEITDPQFKNDLLQADVNEVVIASVLAKGTIVQSILHHGVSKVLDEALTFNEFNEFYIIDLKKPEHKHLRGKTFDELLLPLRKQKILLIAIIVVYYNENGDIIKDEETIKRLLNQDGLERAVILNPITDAEINRKTDSDDHLIVFSTNKKVLEKQIENVKI